MKLNLIQITTLVFFFSLIIGFVACQSQKTTSYYTFPGSKSIVVNIWFDEKNDVHDSYNTRKNYAEHIASLKSDSILKKDCCFYIDTTGLHNIDLFLDKRERASSYATDKDLSKSVVQNFITDYVEFQANNKCINHSIGQPFLNQVINADLSKMRLTTIYFYDSFSYKILDTNFEGIYETKKEVSSKKDSSFVLGFGYY